MRGKIYEDLALEYLKKKGFRILARNYRCTGGEIDIVALDGNVLVFVEVKGARSEDFGHPAERISKRKLLRIIRCGHRFMEEVNWKGPFRLDALIVLGDKVSHFRNLGLDF